MSGHFSLDVKSVSVGFGDRVVLDRLTCHLEGGWVTAIMGPSGSGKSTLLGVLAGYIKPDSGEVVPTTAGDEPVDMAWIFQSSPILARRSAVDNVALGPLSRGQPRREALLRATSAMDALGIAAYAATPAYRMSGGERQRIVVARAIATQAHLILADEPTASLDAANRSMVCQALLTAAEAGSAVAVATHDPAVASICHNILDLRELGSEEGG